MHITCLLVKLTEGKKGETIIMNKKITNLIILTMLLSPLACQETGESDISSSESDEASATFPTELAVASPFDVTDESITESTPFRTATLPAFTSRYAWATWRINVILNTTNPVLCTFDPELFLEQEDNASCFGPTINYEGHPDAIDPTDPSEANGELPPGDLGLWSETDSETGLPCSAAQLNARMNGVTYKSMAALSGLASMICTMNTNGISMPSSASEDLTTEMNALGITDTTFTSAVISHEVNGSGDDQYSYEMELEYSPGGAGPYLIRVQLDHIPGASSKDYVGRLSYLVNNSSAGGNCPSTDVTDNGSLLYERTRIDEMNVEVRQGEFCEHDSDGLVDGQVDPQDQYSSANPTGWGNNFSVLIANYNPLNMEGNFSYAWQAGPDDANSRLFNVTISNSGEEGKAFYGYGDTIDQTSGSVEGFICSWVGPNADQTVQDYAQYQEVNYDSSSGAFSTVDANIVYAPTNSCNYKADADDDGVAEGIFVYDTDNDNDLTDEDPTLDVTADLFEAVDTDSDGNINTIAETIEAEGFTLPVAPANF